MNDYSFLGHLVKAIGYAVVGGSSDQDTEPSATARRTRRTNSSTTRGNKKCCTAKRPGAGAAAGTEASGAPAPVAGASFGKVSPVWPRSGR